MNKETKKKCKCCGWLLDKDDKNRIFCSNMDCDNWAEDIVEEYEDMLTTLNNTIGNIRIEITNTQYNILWETLTDIIRKLKE